VKGTIHWVDATQGIPAEFRLYEPLALDEKVDTDNFLERLNPNSQEIVNGFVEPNMAEVEHQEKFQFFRHGYFNVDSKYSAPGKPVFNRIVSLKSSYDPNAK
jgi:glutaminyl-tRNA synthetase